jgi:hypothetical protein
MNTLALESSMMDNNWHSDTIKLFRTLDTECLKYLRSDARQAAIAGETIDNPKTSQYWDEYHYACMELARRGES